MTVNTQNVKEIACNFLSRYTDSEPPLVKIGNIEDSDSYYFVQGYIYASNEDPEDGYIYCLVDKKSLEAFFSGGIPLPDDPAE